MKSKAGGMFGCTPNEPITSVAAASNPPAYRTTQSSNSGDRAQARQIGRNRMPKAVTGGDPAYLSRAA